jgi:hypothetical protein
MAYRLVKGVYETYRNEGSFYEFYDPDSPSLRSLDRKKGNFMKLITLGNKPIHHFCGWTALVNTILIENILGYHRLNNHVTITPHIPNQWLGNQIQLTIPQYFERIVFLTKADGSIQVTIEFILDKSNSEKILFKGVNHHELICN